MDQQVYPDFGCELLPNGNFKFTWDGQNPVYEETTFICIMPDGDHVYFRKHRDRPFPDFIIDDSQHVVAYTTDSIEITLNWRAQVTAVNPHIRFMAWAVTWNAAYDNVKLDLIAHNPQELEDLIAERMQRKADRDNS